MSNVFVRALIESEQSTLGAGLRMAVECGLRRLAFSSQATAGCSRFACLLMCLVRSEQSCVEVPVR